MEQRETPQEPELTATPTETPTEKPAEVSAQVSAPAQTRAFGRGVPQAQARKAAVDSMPFDRSSIARWTPTERCALYLNQIRKMMIFFVVLAVVGIIAGVILGIVDINTVRNAQQSGTGLGY